MGKLFDTFRYIRNFNPAKFFTTHIVCGMTWRHLNLYWRHLNVYSLLAPFRDDVSYLILFVCSVSTCYGPNYIRILPFIFCQHNSMPINNRMLVWPCLTQRCRCQYIILAGLSRMTNDFTDSWIDWLLKLVVHDVCHIIPSASRHSYRPSISYRPLPGRDIYKHRLDERSPRKTHATPILLPQETPMI